MQFVTIQLTVPTMRKDDDDGFYRVKITQSLLNYGVGHYCGFIENDKGDVIATIKSSGVPKERIDIIFVIEEFNRVMADISIEMRK